MSVKSRAGNGNVEMLHRAFWTTGKWFTLLIIILALWGGSYIVAHSKYGLPGYEYTSFSNAQIRQINRILTTDNIASGIQAARIEKAPVNATFIDSTTSFTPVNEVNTLNTVIGCDLACRIEKVLVYVNSEFDNKVPADQLEHIRQYISTFGPQEVGVFLADYKLKVRSYFWLSGPMIYAELVLWVIGGVLCSLLFTAGNLLRRPSRSVFGAKDILYQVAKIFYAPFIAVVLLLTYNYFRNNTSLNTNLGQGVIIFAFIAGFYSGRLMNFLDKLKQLILPDGEETRAELAIPGYGPQQVKVAVPAREYEAEPVTVQEPVVEERKQPEKEIPLAEEIPTVNDSFAAKKSNGDLIDAQIELKLDAAGLFEDEKARLTKQGFTKAIVTLHNVNGKDIIPAKKANDNSTLFIAHNVKPGIYIARATLSQRGADDQVINLFGERTSYITVDKPGLELYIRKYELVD